jgi:hypothetical protein
MGRYGTRRPRRMRGQDVARHSLVHNDETVTLCHSWYEKDENGDS